MSQPKTSLAAIRQNIKQQKRMILELLNDNLMTAKELSMLLSCGPTTVRIRLNELAERRKVEVVSHDISGTARVRLWGKRVPRKKKRP